MSMTPFDPEALARDASPPQTTALGVELVPDGIRWLRSAFRRDRSPPGTLLDALVDAWAGVLESLAFRHERIVNLGYVATTSQADTLERLAQALALQPSPPLAASTWLAITVQALGGRKDVDVPAGLAVQSVPVGSARPQVFESDTPLSARVEWNAIAVQKPVVAPPSLATDATQGFVARGGLSVGDRVAVTGSVNGEPFVAAVTLTDVIALTPTDVDVHHGLDDSTRPGQKLRRLSWRESLAPAPARSILGARAFELGPATALFGAAATLWEDVDASVRFGLSPARGGLRRLGAPDATAVFSDRSVSTFTRLAGEACAVAARGDVWIAASSSGILRSMDRGVTWTRTGQRTWLARAVCWSDAGLFVGTASHGVVRSVDAGSSWEVLRGGTVVARDSGNLVITLGRLPRCAVGALGVFPSGNGSALVLAGTNAGLYYQEVGDAAWYPHANGLPLASSSSKAGGPATLAVVLEPATGALLLGTDHGLFRASGLDRAWEAISWVGDGKPVSTLGLDPDGVVLVGFEGGGLYRLTSREASSVGVDAPFAAESVRAISTAAGSWWVGTDRGCFWSADGAVWVPVTAGAVRSLAALPEGGVLLASRLDGCEDTEWPGFALEPDHFDLDRIYPRAVPGPALVVDEVNATSLVVNVLRVSVVARVDFGLRGRVTRLDIEPEPRVRSLARRTVRIHPTVRDVGSIVPGSLLPNDAPGLTQAQLLDRELLVDTDIPDPSGRTVLVSGPAVRVRLAAGTALVEAESRTTLILRNDTTATLTSLPVARDGAWVARVVTVEGLVGTVSAPELVLLEGDPKAVPWVVRRNILGFSRSDTFARLTLDEPLGLPFDPGATIVYGNVVSASHGQRVESEVLGSGDPSSDSQRFKLMLPLCWTASATGPAVPSLEVRVSDRTWQRVESRADLTPHDRAYSVQVDMTGTTWIQFGDGTNGARPAAGVENITARYRSGGGAVGNQPAGSIRLLKSRPAGVKAARNLLSATGGGDVESFSDLRSRIPLHARMPDDVVSVPDYLDHLATLAGVAKVAVCNLWNGHAHIIHLTLATTDAENGWALASDSSLADSLRALARQTPIVFDSVEIAWFAASLEIAVEKDLEPDRVVALVERRIEAAFAFDARGIGEPVVPSALVTLAMGVDGVTNAALRRLSSLSEWDTTTVVRDLPGACARLDPNTGEVLPARLWLIAPTPPASSPGTSAAPDSTACLSVCWMGEP